MANSAIEILVTELKILNSSITPPFTIEDKTHGGEDIQMKYRYLEIRRNPGKNRGKIISYESNDDFQHIDSLYLRAK